MIARGNARKLLDECCITGAENLDLIKLAAYNNVFIEEDDIKNHAARIHKTEDCGLIKISSAIKDQGQKRFAIAHELGHFINERNKNINYCTPADLIGLKPKKEFERQANVFAAELLMRDEWVWKFTKRRKPDTQLIKDMAEYFVTSLLSAAIRYAEVGRYPTAIILSKDGTVIWSVINKDFTFKWIPNGYSVNGNSYANEFFTEGRTDTDINEVLADAWFLDDKFYRRNYYIKEQNIYLTSYNSVLTILWED